MLQQKASATPFHDRIRMEPRPCRRIVAVPLLTRTLNEEKATDKKLTALAERRLNPRSDKGAARRRQASRSPQRAAASPTRPARKRKYRRAALKPLHPPPRSVAQREEGTTRSSRSERVVEAAYSPKTCLWRTRLCGWL